MSKLYLIVFAVLISFGTSFNLEAQNTKIFHKGYPLFPAENMDPDTSTVTFAGIQMKDMSYTILNGIIPVGDSTVHHYLLTNINDKGILGWTRKITPNGFNGNPIFSNLIQATNDSVYFTLTFDGGDNRQLIGCVAKNGQGLWVKKFDGGIKNVDTNNGSNLLAQGVIDSLIHQSISINDGENNGHVINLMDLQGNIKESHLHSYIDTNDVVLDGFVIDYKSNFNGFYGTGGLASEDNINASFLKYNLIDSVVLARIYNTADASGVPLLTGLKIVSDKNGDFVIGGQYWDLDPLDLFNSYLGSFVMRVDSLGKIKWSKIIDPIQSQFNALNGLTIDQNGDIVVGGKILSDSGMELVPFLVKLSNEGAQKWFKIYDKASSDFSVFGTVISATDNGFAYVVHDIEDATQDLTKMSLIKTDDKGVVNCETEKPEILFSNFVFTSDTVIVSRTKLNGKNFEDKFKDESFEEFEVQKLSLAVRPFCPNEPIDWTFDADIADAVAWKWSDKSTADTLRVFETGEYTVTVTMEGKYCYFLCDTATLERTDLPQIQALAGPKVCINAPFIVTSSFTASSPVTSKWSTGAENVGSITVTQLGTYSVTITDQCGDTASNSITIGDEIYFPAPSAIATTGPQVCINTPFKLQASGIGGGGGPYTFLWDQNNATTSEITATELKTYRVTVTDRCGLTAVAAVSVDDKIWIGPPVAAAAQGNTVCKDTPITLSGAGAGGLGPYTYLWSTGATTEITTVPNIGTYSLTVTDACKLTSSVSITIDNSIYFPPPKAEIKNNSPLVCKGDPIALTGEGSGGFGLYTYLWSTGATTAIAQVPTIGTYSLIVTDACKQTATANITLDNSVYFPPPKAEIKNNSPLVCKGDPIALTGEGSGGFGLYTYLWSTGATTAIAQVPTTGTYSLIVTDACKQTATANITLDNSVYHPNPTASISQGSKVCEGKEIDLFGSGAGGFGTFTYLWSTGESTVSIKAPKIDKYNLTVTDACKHTGTATISLDEDDSYEDAPTVKIVSIDTANCTAILGLEINPPGSYKYSWSDGSTTPTILVPGNEKYEVTVTYSDPKCKIESDASLSLGALLSDSTACLIYPKIFMPEASMFADNQTFGAFNKCGIDSTNITNFVLKVYNRFGQEVFSTTTISEMWNGVSRNGEPYPPDTYVWYSRYTVGQNCKVETKGDVTIFR